MSRTVMRRLIEIVAVIALVAEIWRFLTTKNTSQDIIVDVIELVGLVIIALVCLYAEIRSARSKAF